MSSDDKPDKPAHREWSAQWMGGSNWDWVFVSKPPGNKEQDLDGIHPIIHTLVDRSALREVEADRAKEAATVDYLRKLVDEKQARIAELEKQPTAIELKRLNQQLESQIQAAILARMERDAALAEVEALKAERPTSKTAEVLRRVTKERDRLRAALERVQKIRSLPLTDLTDTDKERADQYSSVIDGLVFIASKALGVSE